MSLARLKTIMIAALVLLNGFFLGIILTDRYADTRSEQQAIDNVCAILYSNGIIISPGSIKSTVAISTMRTAREVELEAAIAHAFLGIVDVPDQSVIYLYENNERGIAEFFSAGDFLIQLHEGVITDGNDSLRTVRRLIEDMKLETLTPVVTRDAEHETVSVVSAYRGVGIFNSTIDFVFSDGSLITVMGRYVSGVESADDGVGISNVSTALLRFLAAVQRGEIECTEILSVEAGYHHSVVGSFGEGVIAPVWLITTAEVRYIIDSASGDIRQM